MFVLGVTETKYSGKEKFIKDFKRDAFLNHLNPRINSAIIPVINTDEILESILTAENNEELKLLLVSEYGINILNKDNNISLENLCNNILNNEPNFNCIANNILNFLNIVKPTLKNEIERKLKFYRHIDEPFIILADSFLFNLNNEIYCDKIINLRSSIGKISLQIKEKNKNLHNISGIILAGYKLNENVNLNKNVIPVMSFINNRYIPSINDICF